MDTSAGTLAGKTALITGGTTGIGRATAELFVAQGARVIVTGQDATRLDAVVRELGRGVEGIRADQANLADIDRLSDDLHRRGTRIDVLVLNAGIVIPGPANAMTADDFDRQFDVNVRGPFFTVARLADLIADGGTIIAVTSCLDQTAMPGMAAYSATKAALRSFVRTWAAEFKARGIRVNAVAPGPIETPIYGKLGLPSDQLGGMAESIRKQVPMERFGLAEEVAGPILFLASRQAAYVTGEELMVDGGWVNL